ncbi:hypothetical protein [Nocardia asteroides]|uniref:hypothetical protein n=1 Tax=Nocardia asteroides TaxID=1824 RepID=UPI001E3176A3|nr:hypothetical protein [Nocardia asteroides]UGT63940.1 hypothetical protein LTT61_11810 [Nocardia asteroides]
MPKTVFLTKVVKDIAASASRAVIAYFSHKPRDGQVLGQEEQQQGQGERQGHPHDVRLAHLHPTPSDAVGSWGE